MSTLQRKLYGILFLIHFVSGVSCVHANPRNIDSLQNALKVAPKGAPKVEVLLELCRALYYSEPDIVMEYAGQAYQASDSIGDSASKADAALYLAWGNRVTGNPQKSVEFIFKAMSIGKALNRKDLQGRALFLQGTLQIDEENYPAAERLLFEARETLKSVDPVPEYGLAVNALGEVRRYRNQLDEALRAYQESIEISEKIGFNRGALMSRSNIGLVYLARGDYEACRKVMLETSREAKETNSLVVQVEANDAIAQSYILEGNLDVAEQYARMAHETAVKHDMSFYISLTANTMASIFQKRGDIDQTIHYLSIRYETDLTRQKVETQKQIEGLNYNLKLKDKESQIEGLSKDRQVRRLAIFAMGAILGLALIMMLLQIRGSRQRLLTNRMLSRQNERLEELNREKDSLVGIVAHDLKAPLTKVQSLARMMEMIGGLTPQQQDIVQKIEKVTQDGARLIQDLLDISQAETDSRQIETSEFDLNELVQQLIAGHQGHANRKHIQLIWNAHPAGIPMVSEESFVSRVFDNILSNALKYSPDSKKVTVSTTLIDGQACISVADEGPGISEEDQAKMFRKFQKLSARPTAGESSTGLGLAIIKMLVEKLGGYIEVESKLGEGAKFSVYIPTGK
jgi:signal transduction histidine kinase